MCQLSRLDSTSQRSASKSAPSPPHPTLFPQASNQTDLENWVTAIHSASASLLAKRLGKEDTVRLLRSQVRGLLQKIDMDGKMKKMAELQLTVVSNPKNRKAIENQVRPRLAAGLLAAVVDHRPGSVA